MIHQPPVSKFQDFVISITPIHDHEYLIRTDKVAYGVPIVEERKLWDLEEWLSLTQAVRDDSPLSALKRKNKEVSLLHPPNSTPATAPQSLIHLGQILSQALFSGKLGESFSVAQGIAYNQNQIIRIRLWLKEPRLRALPWEILHLNQEERFYPLTTRSDVTFSRSFELERQRRPQVSPPLEIDQPLKILMVASSPNDQEKLALHREIEQLQAELKQTQDNFRPWIQLELLEQPSREELTQTLEQNHYQVFHYAGHSQAGESGGSLLLFNQTTGLSEELKGDELAGLLLNNQIQFAIFNSCESGDTVADHTQALDQPRTLSQVLVKRGIPAVLAMGDKIPDQVAIFLSQILYRNLNQGEPIDVSLARARQGLKGQCGQHTPYWALPILYLRQDYDGQLLVTQTGAKEDSPWAHPSELRVQGEDLSTLSPSSHQTLGQEEASAEAIVKEVLRQVQQQEKTDSQSHSRPSETVSPSNNGQQPPPSESSSQESVNLKPLKPLDSWRWKKISHQIKQWVFLVIIVGLLGGGVWWATRPSETVSSDDPITDLRAIETEKVLNIALQGLTNEELDLTLSFSAIEELLTRNALPYAQSALMQVPPAQQDNPRFYFLLGRLAWQEIASTPPNSDYSLDDARRYWQMAVKKNPQSVSYLNALAFAYYLEGEIEEANNIWFEALDLINKIPSDDWTMTELNTHAGLALGLSKTAETQSGKQKADLILQSLAFREKVLTQDINAFQVNNLAKPENWLWTSALIEEWDALSDLRPLPEPE